MAAYTDSFNRADGGLGSAWTNITADVLAIVSNAVRGGTAGNTHYAHVATATRDFADDHYAQITCTAVTGNDSMGPCVRVNGSGCYSIRADTTSDATRRIVRIDGTTRTVIGTVTITIAANDVLKLTAEGSTIKAYKNGVRQDTATDSTYSTGQPGMFYLRGGTGAGRIDNFEADDISTTTITDVDTDETITTGQTSVAYTGTGLTDADGLLVKSGTKSASATAFSATNATSGTFTAPSLSAVRTGGVKFGSITFDIQDGGVSLATLAGTLNPQTGWTAHNVSDISQAADTGCIYYGQSPSVAVGDQILHQSTTSTGWSVSLDSQGFFTVDSGGSTAKATFDYYVWDDTDNTWGAIGTITINEDTDPGFSA